MSRLTQRAQEEAATRAELDRLRAATRRARARATADLHVSRRPWAMLALIAIAVAAAIWLLVGCAAPPAQARGLDPAARLSLHVTRTGRDGAGETLLAVVTNTGSVSVTVRVADLVAFDQEGYSYTDGASADAADLAPGGSAPVTLTVPVGPGRRAVFVVLSAPPAPPVTAVVEEGVTP